MKIEVKSNQQKFEALKKFNLPIGQYAVTASGPLGIRNLREIQDVDIIVSIELWNELASQYGVMDVDGVMKIAFPGEDIEAFTEGSFYTKANDPDAPSIVERISQAEIIDGLPFESLENILLFKRKMKREKDLKDIQLIEAWQNAQKANHRLN